MWTIGPYRSDRQGAILAAAGALCPYTVAVSGEGAMTAGGDGTTTRTPAAIWCGTCGIPYAAETVYCANCGAPLAPLADEATIRVASQ